MRQSRIPEAHALLPDLSATCDTLLGVFPPTADLLVLRSLALLVELMEPASAALPQAMATGLQSLGAGFSLQSSPLLISVLRRP
jgi:hypothetical protein